MSISTNGTRFFEKCIDFQERECYHAYVILLLLFFLMSITKSVYALIGSFSLAQSAFAATATSTFGAGNVTGLNLGSGGSGATPYAAITNVIVALLSLITLVAVAYVLYAGFQILTAGGDEEKVKVGRKTIINVLIGIVIMWLAYWIVTLVLNALI